MLGVVEAAREAVRHQRIDDLLHALSPERARASELGHGLRAVAREPAQDAAPRGGAPALPVDLFGHPAQAVEEADALVDDGAELAPLVTLAQAPGCTRRHAEHISR